jgi:hypothetical protein
MIGSTATPLLQQRDFSSLPGAVHPPCQLSCGVKVARHVHLLRLKA